MVVYCTVCLNNTRQNKNVSYFNYPKEYNRRHNWLKAVGREDLLLKLVDDKTRQQYRICEDHFERNCIKFSKKRTVKYLFDHALPTLKLPSNESASPSSIQENAFPMVNLPSNAGENLNQFENVSQFVQDNQEIQLLLPSKSNKFLNKISNGEEISNRVVPFGILKSISQVSSNEREEKSLMRLNNNVPTLTPEEKAMQLTYREKKLQITIDNQKKKISRLRGRVLYFKRKAEALQEKLNHVQPKKKQKTTKRREPKQEVLSSISTAECSESIAECSASTTEYSESTVEYSASKTEYNTPTEKHCIYIVQSSEPIELSSKIKIENCASICEEIFGS